MTILQEYNLEIKPAKIVKGQGFCRLVTGINDTSIDEVIGNIEQITYVLPISTQSQYVDLIFYLKNGYDPLEMDVKKKRALRLRANQYHINDVLFRRNYDFVFLICLEKTKVEKVL